ncbi:MAG TPA: TolC family protein [Chitinophagaceae bacterium]|nr:TolC family protein [Chitinophagaceae bacterium]
MKKFLTNTTLWLVGLFAGWPYGASLQAQQAPQPLSLARAVQLAVTQYPTIQAYQERVHAGEARVQEARAAWLPSARVMEQVAAGTDNSLTGGYFPMGIIPTTVGGVRPASVNKVAVTNFAVVTGQWELYNFGAYQALTREAQASLDIDRARLGKESFSIQGLVISQYFTLAQYYSLMAIQQRNIDRTQAVTNAIKAFVNNGLKPGVDSSVAEAELSKARLTYIELKDAYDVLRSKLALLTGLDTTAIIPDTTVNTRLAGILYAQVAPDSAAVDQHPVITYYRSVYQDQLAREKLISRSYLPKVYFMASGLVRGSSITPADKYQADLGSGLSYSRYNYLSGLAITYDLFDGKRKRLQLNEQRFESRAAQKDLEAARTLVSSEVQQADIAIRTALDKLREIPVQVRAASEAYEQKLALYNAGLTNIIDLTNALYVLNRAETDYVGATAGAWNALFRKAYATNALSQLLSSLN